MKKSNSAKQPKANGNETLELADIQTLQFMVAATQKAHQNFQAADAALKMFAQGHVTAKYKLQPGDGLDLATGKITRKVGS